MNSRNIRNELKWGLFPRTRIFFPSASLYDSFHLANGNYITISEKCMFRHDKKRILDKSECSYTSAIYFDEEDFILAYSTIHTNFVALNPDKLTEVFYSGESTHQIGVHKIYYSRKSSTLLSVGSEEIKFYELTIIADEDTKHLPFETLKFSEIASISLKSNMSYLNPTIYDERNDQLILLVENEFHSYDMNGVSSEKLVSLNTDCRVCIDTYAENGYFLMANSVYGVVVYDSFGQVYTRTGVCESSVLFCRFIDEEYIVLINDKYDVFVVDYVIQRLYVVGKLEFKPENLVLVKFGKSITFAVTCQYFVYFFDLTIPFKLWVGKLDENEYIKLVPKDDHAARLVVKSKGSFVTFIGPKGPWKLTTASDKNYFSLKNIFYDRKDEYDRLLMTTEKGYLTIYETNTMPCSIIYSKDLYALNAGICIYNNRRCYIVLAYTGEYLILDCSTFEILHRASIGRNKYKDALFDSESNTAIFFLKDRLVWCEINSPEKQEVINMPLPSVSEVSNGYLYIGHNNGKMQIFKLESFLTCVNKSEGVVHSGPITGFEFLSDCFMTCSLDFSIKLWSNEYFLLSVIRLPIPIYSIAVINYKRDIVVAVKNELMIIDGGDIFPYTDPINDDIDNQNIKDDILFQVKRPEPEEEKEEVVEEKTDCSKEKDIAKQIDRLKKLKKGVPLTFSADLDRMGDDKLPIPDYTEKDPSMLTDAERAIILHEMNQYLLQSYAPGAMPISSPPVKLADLSKSKKTKKKRRKILHKYESEDEEVDLKTVECSMGNKNVTVSSTEVDEESEPEKIVVKRTHKSMKTKKRDKTHLKLSNSREMQRLSQLHPYRFKDSEFNNRVQRKIRITHKVDENEEPVPLKEQTETVLAASEVAENPIVEEVEKSPPVKWRRMSARKSLDKRNPVLPPSERKPVISPRKSPRRETLGSSPRYISITMDLNYDNASGAVGDTNKSNDIDQLRATSTKVNLSRGIPPLPPTNYSITFRGSIFLDEKNIYNRLDAHGSYRDSDGRKLKYEGNYIILENEHVKRPVSNRGIFINDKREPELYQGRHFYDNKNMKYTINDYGYFNDENGILKPFISGCFFVHESGHRYLIDEEGNYTDSEGNRINYLDNAKKLFFRDENNNEVDIMENGFYKNSSNILVPFTGSYILNRNGAKIEVDSNGYITHYNQEKELLVKRNYFYTDRKIYLDNNFCYLNQNNLKMYNGDSYFNEKGTKIYISKGYHYIDKDNQKVLIDDSGCFIDKCGVRKIFNQKSFLNKGGNIIKFLNGSYITRKGQKIEFVNKYFIDEYENHVLIDEDGFYYDKNLQKIPFKGDHFFSGSMKYDLAKDGTYKSDCGVTRLVNSNYFIDDSGEVYYINEENNFYTKENRLEPFTGNHYFTYDGQRIEIKKKSVRFEKEGTETECSMRDTDNYPGIKDYKPKRKSLIESVTGLYYSFKNGSQCNENTTLQPKSKNDGPIFIKIRERAATPQHKFFSFHDPIPYNTEMDVRDCIQRFLEGVYTFLPYIENKMRESDIKFRSIFDYISYQRTNDSPDPELIFFEGLKPENELSNKLRKNFATKSQTVRMPMMDRSVSAPRHLRGNISHINTNATLDEAGRTILYSKHNATHKGAPTIVIPNIGK